MVKITNIFKETKEKLFINEQSSEDKGKDEVASLSSVDFVFKRLEYKSLRNHNRKSRDSMKKKIVCCKRNSFLCVYIKKR